MKPTPLPHSVLLFIGLLAGSCSSRDAAPQQAPSSSIQVQSNGGASTVQFGTGADAITIELAPGVEGTNGSNHVVTSGNSQTTTVVNGVELKLESDRILVGGRAFGPVHAGSRVKVTTTGVSIDGRTPLPRK